MKYSFSLFLNVMFFTPQLWTKMHVFCVKEVIGQWTPVKVSYANRFRFRLGKWSKMDVVFFSLETNTLSQYLAT